MGAKIDERQECHKGSGNDKSEYEYDDKVSLHADDDSELAGNLNNIWGTNKESEDEDSDSVLKGFVQELDKNEKIGKKSIKISQILRMKFDKALMLWKNSKKKWKNIKNHGTVLTYSWKNAIKRFGKNEWMLRIAIKAWKCKKSRGKFSNEHLPFLKSKIP